MRVRILLLSGAAVLTAPHLAFADAYDKYRIACNAQQTAELTAAVRSATNLAQKASAALPPIDSLGGKRFQRWFGGREGDYDPVIKSVYDEMQFLLLFKTFWCLPQNSTTPETWFHTNAFVLRGGVGEIFVLSNFFRLPIAGTASRGGTLVHESAHQSTKHKIIDDDINGDGVNDYGWANAERRATQYPDWAKVNSDNYKYFAEDVVYGVP